MQTRAKVAMMGKMTVILIKQQQILMKIRTVWQKQDENQQKVIFLVIDIRNLLTVHRLEMKKSFNCSTTVRLFLWSLLKTRFLPSRWEQRICSIHSSIWGWIRCKSFEICNLSVQLDSCWCHQTWCSQRWNDWSVEEKNWKTSKRSERWRCWIAIA